MSVYDTDWSGVTLHFLRGLPRAGKSTRAAQLVREHGGVVVSAEAMRLALYNSQHNPQRDREVRNAVHLMARALVASDHRYLILDGVYTHAADIDAFVDAVVPLQYLAVINVKAEYINTDPRTCIRRALDNSQGCGICRGIIRMASQNDWDQPYEYNHPTPDITYFMED